MAERVQQEIEACGLGGSRNIEGGDVLRFFLLWNLPGRSGAIEPTRLSSDSPRLPRVGVIHAHCAGRISIAAEDRRNGCARSPPPNFVDEGDGPRDDRAALQFGGMFRQDGESGKPGPSRLLLHRSSMDRMREQGIIAART